MEPTRHVWLGEYIFNNFQADYLVSKIAEKNPCLVRYILQKCTNYKVEYKGGKGLGEVGYYIFVVPAEYEKEIIKIIKENKKRLNELAKRTHAPILAYDSYSQIRK